MSDRGGFQVYALDSPQTIRTIRAKLERIKADRTEELRSSQSWEDFKGRVGRIEGLEDALHVCSEIEQAERA